MAKTIYLTSGTSWFVPLDFNTTNNTIECWGAGGGGGTSGGGGGGGAYSRITNAALTVGAFTTVAIGAGGGPGQAGGDTSISSFILAKGGKGWGSGFTGQGGQASESIGTVKFSGGNGGLGGNASGRGGGGGGGAAGASGNGANGNATASSTGATGGAGGAPSGGAGGTGTSNATTANPGGNSTVSGGYGAGGGGGGGGTESDSYGDSGGTGGAGGLYGGGGGGAGWGSASGGRGGNGFIKITYEPVAVPSYLRVITFSNSGSWTVPAGVTAVNIKIWGGGGGGAYWPPGSSINTWIGLSGSNTTITGPFGAGGSNATATAFAGSGGTFSSAGVGGSASTPAGWSVGSGGNGQFGRLPSTGLPGGNGGLDGGLGAIWAGRDAAAPGGGGAAWSNTNDNGNGRSSGSGGGGGAAAYGWVNPPAGAVLNFTVGAGGSVVGSAISQRLGAAGQVVIAYVTAPVIVPTGFDVVPGKPTGPIGMDKIAQAFLGYGDIQPAAPYAMNSYYPNNITDRTHSSAPGPINTDVRVLRYGYGIQTTPNYTQSVPNSGPLSFGNYKGTYQTLNMRVPRFITSSTNYEPPFQTYAQYDQIQYTYTGQPQTFNFYNARVIMIECWGGHSGVFSNQNITPGGYSAGVYVSPTGGELYVYVGGSSSYLNGNGFVNGGWNGGGAAYHFQSNSNNWRAAGGGATDVRTIRASTNPPLSLDGTWSTYWSLADTIASLNSRIIVAGGAGGGGYWLGSINQGGFGGGNTGGAGANTNGENLYGTGGTQSSAGVYLGSSALGMALAGFGFGGSKQTTTTNTLSGGGGGWYGGGGGIMAGGGSGYVGGMLPNTATGSLNFGITTVNAQSGQSGYVTNGLAPNGLVNIFIIG